MPRLLDPGGYAPAVRAAASRLIAERGLPGLTLRAIAGEAGISPATIVHQFTHRARLWGYLAVCAKSDHLYRAWGRSRYDGVLALLPSSEDEVLDMRILLAWCELARSDEVVAPAITDFREQQRALLDDLTDRSLDEAGLDVLVAVVDGLNVAMCAREDPLPVERARAALTRHCPDHVSDGPRASP